MTETIHVTVSSSRASKKDLTVTTISYGKLRPVGVGADRMTPGTARFFDVFVDGVAGDKVTVSITHDDVGPGHQMDHWDGMQWVRHKEKTVAGNTIRAEFEVSDLGKTPIVIGT